MDVLTQKLIKSAVAVVIAILLGTFGFWLLAPEPTPLFGCFYMTIISLSTTGYGEVIPLNDHGRLFASLLIIFGMGTLIYLGSTIVAFVVEVDVNKIRRRKKMMKTINGLSNHIIVCGVGTTGSRIAEELLDTRTPFILLDTSEESLAAFRDSRRNHSRIADLLELQGDATEDSVLQQAGIGRARGLIAALRSDKDNLYLTLSARQINPSLRIVARATEQDAQIKMTRAGADAVISPNLIGAMRMVSEMIRPASVALLDEMVRDKKLNHRFEEARIPPQSGLAGLSISDTGIRKAADVLIIALRNTDCSFIYMPPDNTILSPGSSLVVLGSVDAISALNTWIAQHI